MMDSAPTMSIAGPMPPMAQGIGYDQYLPMVRQRMRMAPPMVRMPAPPPRFPTPGRMDGMRLVKRRPDYEEYVGPGGMGMTRNITRAIP